MRWHVRIIGNRQHLDSMSQSLTGTPIALTLKADGYYYLTAPQVEGCQSPQDARAAAGQIVSMLKGATLMSSGDRPDVEEQFVLEQKADGTEQMYLEFHEDVRARVSADMTIYEGTDVVAAVHPIVVNPFSAWITGASADEAVAKVFRLLARELDWTNLSRIYEVVEGDVGGLGVLTSNGWVTAAQISSLKGTANNPSESGDDSRHGHQEKNKPMKNPIPITEARAIVETLVHQWIRSKGFQRPVLAAISQ